MGLGNKSNGGRANRLWRGKRRKHWNVVAQVLNAPAPVKPEGPATFGPSGSEGFDAASAGLFGPVGSEGFDGASPGLFGPVLSEILEIRMQGIKGKQLADGPIDGVSTVKLNDNAVTAAKLNYTGETYDFSGATALRTGTPLVSTDVANKAYVDSLAAGLDPKASVRLATTAALPTYTPAGSGIGKTLTATANAALTIDSVLAVATNRVLIKDEGGGTSIQNGIYTVTQAGSGVLPFILTRATDFDGTPSGEVSDGSYTFVGEGPVNGATGWFVTTNDPITVDVTAITFSQFNRNSKLTTGNKSQAPSVTAGNFSTTGLTIAITPSSGAQPIIFINSIRAIMGNGNRSDLGSFTGNVEAYFSADGGATARSVAAIVAGDTLFWNGTNAGYDLAITDQVSMEYEIL